MGRKKMYLLDIPLYEFMNDRIQEDTFNNRKPCKVRVLDEWYPVQKWVDVKRITYNVLISKHGVKELPGKAKISKNKSDFQIALKLDKGLYSEAHTCADIFVRHCRIIIKAYGYKFKDDWDIEIDNTFKRKPNSYDRLLRY